MEDNQNTIGNIIGNAPPPTGDTADKALNVVIDTVKGATKLISTATKAPEYEDYMQGEVKGRSMFDIGLPQAYTTPSAIVMTPIEDRKDFASPEDQNKSATDNTIAGLKAGFDMFVGQTPRFMYEAYDLENNVVDTKYIGLKDPRYEALSDSEKIAYMHRFADSPNYDYTTKLLEKIKTWEQYGKDSENAPVSSIVGSIVGGVVDPLVLLALPAGISKGALAGAGFGVATTAMQSAIDPRGSLTTESVATGAVIGAALGGILGGASKYFGKKEMDRILESAKGNYGKPAGIASEGMDAGAAFNRNPNKYESDRFTVKGTNIAFNVLFKHTKGISAQTRMQGSVFPTLREAGQLLTQGKLVTQGFYDMSEVAPGSIIGKRNVTTSTRFKTIEHEVDSVYTDFLKGSTGKVSRSDLLNSAVAHHTGAVPSTNTYINRVASKIDEQLSKAFDDLKSVGSISKDAIRPTGWFPHVLDKPVVSRNIPEFRSDIYDEVIRQLKLGRAITKVETATGDATKDVGKMLSDEQMNRLANDISREVYDRLVGISEGNVRMVGNTKSRFTNFNDLEISKDFWYKWGTKDKESALYKYFNEAYTEIEAKALSADEELLVKLQRGLNSDYETLLKKIESSNDSLADKSKAAEQLAKEYSAAKKDLEYTMKLYNGDYARETSGTARTINMVMSGLTSLSLLGQSFISNITDLAYAIYKGGSKAPLLNHVSQFADEVTKFSAFKDPASELDKLGLMIDKFSISNMGRDISEVGYGQTGKVEKVINQVYTGFTKINLMAHLQDFNVKMTSENMLTDMLIRATKLVEGKIEPGSVDAVESGLFGLDKNLAERMLEQMKLHGEKVGKTFYSGFDEWDEAVKFEVGGKLDDYLKSKVMQATNGSVPELINNPRLRMFFQFQKFIYSSYTKLLLPILQKSAGLGFETTAKTLGKVFTDFTLAVLGNYARQKYINQKDDTKLDTGFIITSAIERSAILALVGLGSNYMDIFGVGTSSLLGTRKTSRMNDRGNLETLLGPAINIYGKGLTAASKAAFTDESLSTSDYMKLKQMIPFQNLWLWNWYFNGLIKGDF